MHARKKAQLKKPAKKSTGQAKASKAVEIAESEIEVARIGEKIDDAISETAEAAEEAGENIEEAAEEAADKIKGD